MISKNSISRFVAGLCFALAICFGVQGLSYYRFDFSMGKSESNYFSTMSRFQAGAKPAAEIAFAGSSITGRLPGRESGNRSYVNLGSDGGPALDGMRLIAMNQIDTPEWLVIETNTLYGGVGFSDTLVVKGAQGLWFDVGARLPLLGASARPSGMLYASLLRRPKVLTGEAFTVVESEVPVIASSFLSEFTPGERKRFDDYVSAIVQLQKRGVRILLVTYPAGEMREREKFLIKTTVLEWAERFDVIYIDMGKQIPRDELEFTDSVHLGPESAARVLQTIANFCDLKNQRYNK